MKGSLVGEYVIVDGKDADVLTSKYFGFREGKKLYLSLIEAAYLCEKKKLKIYLNDKLVEFDEFVNYSLNVIDRFLPKYLVYKDLKGRGYLVKTAFKYGADFRVYEKGATPGREHSKWIVFVVTQDDALYWNQIASMVRVAHSVKKDLLIGVVDEEGDVTYYVFDWIKP